VCRGGRTIMVPLASLLRPWLTASSSSDSESSTRLHHSSYLVILLISSSILSGPTFAILIFSRNLSKRFSHHGFPSRVPIDRGRVKAPVVGSFHTSRRTASKVGQLGMMDVKPAKSINQIHIHIFVHPISLSYSINIY
jgi:hypothetical protein